MFRAIFSDHAKGPKVACLLLAYACLATLFWWDHPRPGLAWQQAIWAALDPDLAGRPVSFHLQEVADLLPGQRGFQVRLGPDRVELNVVGAAEVEPGDVVDFSGHYLSPLEVKLESLRVHRGERWKKIWFSLAAAALTVGLFLLSFRWRPAHHALFWPRD